MRVVEVEKLILLEVEPNEEGLVEVVLEVAASALLAKQVKKGDDESGKISVAARGGGDGGGSGN